MVDAKCSTDRRREKETRREKVISVLYSTYSNYVYTFGHMTFGINAHK